MDKERGRKWGMAAGQWQRVLGKESGAYFYQSVVIR